MCVTLRAGVLYLAKSLEGACRRWHRLIQSGLSIDLMVTELAINALSHACPCDRSDGTVVVTYESAEPNWSLTVSDNGIG